MDGGSSWRYVALAVVLEASNNCALALDLPQAVCWCFLWSVMLQILEQIADGESSYNGGEVVHHEEEEDEEVQEGIVATTFLFNLGNELIRGEILRRIFETHRHAYESLHLLCTLRLVCRAWKQWVDSGFEWTVVTRLYQEDLEVLNEAIWAEEEEEIEY
jgi:hypothetical protein